MGKSDKVKKVENAKEKLKKESGSRKAEAAPAAEPDGKAKVVQKDEKAEPVREAEKEDRSFETRLGRHMDELKWLYMELYDSQEHFDDLLKNLKGFYEDRKASL